MEVKISNLDSGLYYPDAANPALQEALSIPPVQCGASAILRDPQGCLSGNSAWAPLLPVQTLPSESPPSSSSSPGVAQRPHLQGI